MSQAVNRVKIDLPGRWRDPDFHLSALEAGSGLPVVFCHGFPDLAIGWEAQLPAVAAAGYRAIAPDMRGYGSSSGPHEIEAYAIDELCGDLVALLDALDIERAIFVGHDWGGFVTWAMPVLHPERVLGVVGACTPYMPFPTTDIHLATVDGEVERQYVAWFQQDGVAEANMNPQAQAVVDKIMRTAPPLEEVMVAAFADGKLNMNPFMDIDQRPDMGEPLLAPDTYSEYVETFSRTGFRGGINWYRNIDANAARFPDIGVKPLDLPCLMLTAERDPALRPEFAADMPERCSDLEMHLIERAGHWVQQEQAEAFNDHLLRWLRARFPA